MMDDGYGVEIEAGAGDGYAVIMSVSRADALLAALFPAAQSPAD